MKLRLMIAVLALSSFAFAQHGGGGGHAGGAGGVGGAATGGATHGSVMDSSHAQTSSQMSSTNSGRTPSEILSRNTKLSSNLDNLLPHGMTAQQACSGFKNLGQCVSAIHVSHNLDIPFADLKSKVTGSGSVSLGKAIEGLKPGADAKSETKKAKQQAQADLSGNS